MSKAGARHQAEKRDEVDALVAQAVEKASGLADAPDEVIEEQLARIAREGRANALFGACRQQIINEPALWFRAPDHEGAVIAEIYMREAYAEMVKRATEHAEPSIVLPS